MKKTYLLIVSLIAVSLLGACKSGPTAEEEQQGEVNLSFDNVYSKYESRLILDNTTDYVVKSGDMLTRIARQFYGTERKFGVSNAYFFPLIMLASNDVVQDPDLIEPGMHLSIPDLQRNLDNPDARQAMKEFFKDIAGVYAQKTRDETRVDRRTLAEETQHSLLELSEML
jgi:hypothetical protein